jgi:hypothetical protein
MYGNLQTTGELNTTQGFPAELWFSKMPDFWAFSSLENG